MSERRPALVALDEYLTALRSTGAFVAALDERYDLGVYRQEVDRQMATMAWRDPDRFSAWMPDPNPDGVRPLGSGRWSWGPDGKVCRLHVDGLLCHHGWVDAHGIGWGVEHSLTERHAGVWLGVANNSARRDIPWADAEAWPMWCARAALDAERGQG